MATAFALLAASVSAIDAADAPDGVGATSTDAETPWTWDIPVWLPPPPVPADNPMSAAKVELGRYLFHDARLSSDDTMACSSCHDQALAFTDGLAITAGVGGVPGHRNAQGLANVGYSPALTWASPLVRSLEIQSLIPLFSDAPTEMGNIGQEKVLFERLGADARYRELFGAAFPGRRDADDAPDISLFTITRALAAFQRTLISADSPYDRYKYGGDPQAISASAKRGEALFFSERFECYHCHDGFNFTDTLRTSRHRFDEIAFHNTGLYDVDGRGSYPAADQGLHAITLRDRDRGRFRTQSLRNVALTAPYFHDGSAATLIEAIEHYAAGGRRIEEGPTAGDGARSVLKNPLVLGFELDPDETTDLIDFLGSLTDEKFVTDARFSDPWPGGHPASRKRHDVDASIRTADAAHRHARALPIATALALILLFSVALARRSSDRHSGRHFRS